MDKVKDCLKKCRLYNFNSRRGIRALLGLSKNLDLDNVKKELLPYYSYFYLKKPTKSSKKETLEERRTRYLLPSESSDFYESRPDDYSKNTYRMLININENWLRNSLKKINKILSQSLIEKNGKEINYPIPYLHSSLKKRSYTTNAISHKNNKYLLAIDIQSFYPNIPYKKILNFFRYDMCLSKDIAEIYTALCTCPLDDPVTGKYDYGLGQGLATSPILAYLSNYRMFDFIYELAKKSGLDMTVYVDDVVFSSNKPIKQEFIDALFGAIKNNHLNINKRKVKIYGPNRDKKITGVCITSTGKIRVPRSKHEEVKVQYDYLSEKILKIKNTNDYFKFYNLFLRFKGNIQFILLVEGRVTSKHQNFIREYNDYFLYGIRKIKKSNQYSKENLSNEDYDKFLKKYEKLRKKIDSLK